MFSWWSPSDWRRTRRVTMRAANGHVTTATIPGNYFFWVRGRRVRIFGLEILW